MMMTREIYTSSTGSPISTHRKFQSFTVNFFGTRIRTVVTSNPSVIRRWIQYIRFILRTQLRHRSIVGLGVQWLPARSRGGDDPADTLQLCVANRCLIIQLSQARSLPRILRRFLDDSVYKFVGIRNNMDAEKLEISPHHLYVCRPPLNLVGYSTRPFSYTSMETMAVDFLRLNGVRKDPEIAMSRWNAQWLNKEQVQYACVDAHVSYLVAKKLQI